MRHLLLFFFVVLCAIGGISFNFLSSLSLNEASLGVISDSYKFPPKFVFYYYIKYFRVIKASDDELNPLHFTFNGCYELLPYDKNCDSMINLILSSKNISIDTPANDKSGLTPLHGAVLSCSLGAVKYTLLKGASVNSIISGETSIAGMSALRLLEELKTCEHRSGIKSFLLKNGAIKTP